MSQCSNIARHKYDVYLVYVGFVERSEKKTLKIFEQMI